MAHNSRGGAPSRAQQAFRWLLSDDGDGGKPQGRQRAPGDKRKGAKGGRRASDDRRPYTPGFQLREDAAAEGTATGSELAVLQAAFQGAVGADLVADVFAACGGDAAAASEALLALAGAGGAEPLPATTVGQAAGGTGPAGEPGEAAAATGGWAPPGDACAWDTLPNECKWLIFEQLSVRDLARAARACREWAEYAREQRRSLRSVAVPEGATLAAVRSLVAAFGRAEGVSLWRCAAALRFEHQFEDVLRAVALGQADRPGGVPVSELSLARCGRATDGVVGAACDALRALRRLDLSRCVEVGDGALLRLAAYERSDEPCSDVGEEGGGSSSEGEAAAAGVGGLRLGTGDEAAAPPAPAIESPDSAVRRIAAQRHADMMERSAAAARAQHGRPAARGLEQLLLRDTSVSQRGLKRLLQPGSAAARSLRALDVSRCPNLGADLDLPPRAVLEELRASGCTSLRAVVIQLPPEAPLRALCLDGCRQLGEVTLVAPRLETLNLSHCGQLRSLTLRCRRLRELRAVNCSNLSLAAGELVCPELREVNLFGCRALDAEGLEAAAASLAKCTALDLTGCISLPRLLLPEATELRTVSVSGCSVLRQVLLASPLLSRFKAAGCVRLMDVRLGTASLALLDLENCDMVREVQLSEDAAPPGGGARPTAEPGARRGGAADGGAAPPRPRLVLKGCAALPEGTKARLRAAVLGRPSP